MRRIVFFRRKPVDHKSIILEAIKWKVSVFTYLKIRCVNKVDRLEELKHILNEREYIRVTLLIEAAFERQIIWYKSVSNNILGNKDYQEFYLDY